MSWPLPPKNTVVHANYSGAIVAARDPAALAAALREWEEAKANQAKAERAVHAARQRLDFLSR